MCVSTGWWFHLEGINMIDPYYHQTEQQGQPMYSATVITLYISLSNFNSNTWLVYGHLITLYNSAVIDATNNTYLLFIYMYMLRTSVMDHDFLYDIIVVCFRNWGFYLLEICYFEVIVVWWQIWVQEHRRGSVYYTDSFIF